MLQNILLTGGNGFIGSYVLEKCIKENYFIYLLLRKDSNTKRIDFIDTSKYKIIYEDELEYIFKEKNIYGVIHIATCYKKFHEAIDIEEMIFTNITLPTKILQLSVSFNTSFFINTGTFFEYDFSDSPLTEESKEKSFNLYASTKTAFQKILEYYSQNFNIKTITLRLFSPYGPKDNMKFIPVVIQNIINDKEMHIENKFQKLHFTYVGDIVDAYLNTIKNIEKIKSNYEIINIAPDKKYSLFEIINIIEIITRKKLQITYGEGKENEIWHSSHNSKKANKLIGWNAKTDIKEGLQKTLDYYKK